jgi:demethylmenaquinone methyltransferase/2-methoxy-6-polyprenyl-1,4-benzoquinol methylase
MPFDHFDFIAPLYHRASTYLHFDTMLRCADLPTTGRLLDVGGGTGRVVNVFRHHAKQVVLVDPSRGMLHFSASFSNLQPAAAISEHLPFPDESFDRILMVDTMHHVINQAQTAREMWRVVKPGGRIVIEEPDIHVFGVKLIALAEKLLLMRSHFLSPAGIAKLFGQAKTSIHIEGYTAWVVVQK